MSHISALIALKYSPPFDIVHRLSSSTTKPTHDMDGNVWRIGTSTTEISFILLFYVAPGRVQTSTVVHLQMVL